MIAAQSKATAITLDGALTVRGIEAVRATLANALAQHDVVTLDCTSATTIDLSLIQLLLAAHASARHAGKTLRLAAPAGGVLRAALDRGGFLTGEAADAAADAAFWLAQEQTAP